MKLELADIATNEKHVLKGFKVLGVFPFYLKYIRVDTQIQLSAIHSEINKITNKEASLDDFNNLEIQSKFAPLFKKYCLTGLVNSSNKDYGTIKEFIYKKLVLNKLNKKIEQCGYKQLFSLYSTIRQLNEPAFFFTCWKDLRRKENTILSEEKQS